MRDTAETRAVVACTVVVSPTEIMASTGSHSSGGTAPEFTDVVTGLSTTVDLWRYTVACADQVFGEDINLKKAFFSEGRVHP